MSSTLVIKANLLMTSKSNGKDLIKASITWDHPCYLHTLIHISYACVHLDNPSEIIGTCYLELLDTYLIMHWVAFASA